MPTTPQALQDVVMEDMSRAKDAAQATKHLAEKLAAATLATEQLTHALARAATKASEAHNIEQALKDTTSARHTATYRANVRTVRHAAHTAINTVNDLASQANSVVRLIADVNDAVRTARAADTAARDAAQNAYNARRRYGARAFERIAEAIN